MFHPWLIANTQIKSSWDPPCWCLFCTKQTLSSSLTEYVPRNLCLGTLELPGILEEAEMSCLYRKKLLVSGWWEEKVTFLALPDPLAKTHSLPRVLSRPPASTTAFSKELEAIRRSNMTICGKELTEETCRIQRELFQESLHQWRRKNGLACLRGTNTFFKSTD